MSAIAVAPSASGTGTVSLAAPITNTDRTLSLPDVSGTVVTDATVFSGTYTPTLTNVTNIAVSTAFSIQYVRIGSVVTVSGRVTIDPTAAGAIELGVTLPIASNFAALQELGGTFANGFGDVGMCVADATNDRASLQATVVDAGSRVYGFNFTYRII